MIKICKLGRKGYFSANTYVLTTELINMIISRHNLHPKISWALSASDDDHQGPILLTWINFNLSMDK